MQSVAPKNCHIITLTKAFLSVHWDREKPILLGYSGGPDSKALLYSLLECGVVPTIAHVDHGWRKESREEALFLEEEAKKLGCPFFTTRLEPKEYSEDEARKGRFAFFSKIAPSFAALVLAHQADDLAETVLKRLFEGANLTRCGGMQEVSKQHQMAIWRPFLKVSKGEILQFLDERGLHFFQDSTNEDPSYLRVRMRKQMFPLLAEHFGKEVKENLILLSERADELREYLDKKVESVVIHRGPWGLFADLRGLHTLEQKHLMQKIVPLNRDQLATLISWVQKGAKSKQLLVGQKKIFIDDGRIWVHSRDL